jgi:hypothetical protein
MPKHYLLALAAVIFSLNIAVASAQPTGQDLNYILSLFANPSVLLIFGIELLLGIGLGYFAIKALKYVVAVILILALGIILNIWQSPNILKTVQEQLGIGMSQLWSVMLSLVYAFGVTTILPISLGFIIGIILAIIR